MVGMHYACDSTSWYNYHNRLCYKSRWSAVAKSFDWTSNREHGFSRIGTHVLHLQRSMRALERQRYSPLRRISSRLGIIYLVPGRGMPENPKVKILEIRNALFCKDYFSSIQLACLYISIFLLYLRLSFVIISLFSVIYILPFHL